jgi:phenylpropionate dioxygenase-like ring-hydroxylating dioxygenase large terminal subunit
LVDRGHSDLALTNTSELLRHAWHVVATCDEVADGPHQVWLLGDAWALVRLAGQLVAFVDRCPHRLAPLSIGSIVGDELQCGYHGWRFGTGGRCTAIPALGATDHIPSRARATTPYGLEERYGLIWLAPAVPVSPIPEFPEWEQGGFDQIRTTIRSTTASVGQLVDNFLDASHFPFVHARTFGDDKAARVVDDGIERDGWTVRTQFSTWYRNFDDPQVATGEHDAVQPQDLLKQGSASMTVYLRLFFPITQATLSILFACQPEAATCSRIYKLVARNDTHGDAQRIARTIDDEDLILLEDLAVLERYTAMELHLDTKVELHTRGDRLSLAWRRLLADWANQYRRAEEPSEA